MHPTRADLDDEQDAEPAKQRGVDAREVGRDDRPGLGTDELRPGRSGAITGRVYPRGTEDLPARRRGDTVAAPAVD